MAIEEGYIDLEEIFKGEFLFMLDLLELNYWTDLIRSDAVDSYLTGEDLAIEAIKNNWCFLQIN